MKNPFGSRELSETLRRRVELAIAVAQERLLATHVDHALRLIKLISDQVRFENALGIYTRMLRLSDDEARIITTRALAVLGEQGIDPTLIMDRPPETEEEEPGSAPRNFIRIMRQRLRGRVKDDLRRWVELAAARTEVALFHTHVGNALHFVELLDNELPSAESVELYLDALEVRESIAEVVYYMALGNIADEQLPQGPRAQRPARTARTERNVQLAEGGG